jgi:hypothetical protein
MKYLFSLLIVLNSSIVFGDTVWVPMQIPSPYQTTIVIPPEPYVPKITIRPEWRLIPVVKLMPVKVQKTGPFGRVIEETVEMQPFTFWEYTTVFIRVLE